jgi:acrylyl-CoA reductase (NADPH)
MTAFPAWLALKDDDGYRIERRELTDDDLMDGDVTVAVEYSTLNYKDGLALTGKAPVIRQFPLVPGIDLAGRVIESGNPAFQPGDAVLLNGYGIGEAHHGGYAGRARVRADWLLKIPQGLDTRQAMAIGTAGYTAMLCILRLEEHGIRADGGPLVLSGAAGGVGSIALAVLGRLGYELHAITGRDDQAGYLESLGAARVLPRADFARPARPLGRETWQAGIDVAGGHTLANILSQIRYGGAVAACGLAESMDLPASVAPFILRGVTLYGVDSVQCPMPRRIEAWNRLAKDLDLELLERLSQEIDFERLPEAGEEILAGRIRGRAVIRIPD